MQINLLLFFKKITTPVILSALFLGMALTLWGLFHMSWPEAIPWAGKSSFFRYFLFMCLSAGLVIFGSFRYKLNPFVIGVCISLTLVIFAGAFWPLLVTIWFVISSFILGSSFFELLNIDIEDDWISKFLVGAGLYGTAVGLLAHFPVNYPFVYFVALTVPVFLNQRKVCNYFLIFKHFFNDVKEFKKEYKWLDVAIVVIALVHLIVALMPEIGHDALAMHLFIPAHLSSRQMWGFDANTYVWAVMPMLGDWIFSVGYMIAGETACRLMNITFIFLLGFLVRELVIWAGGTFKNSRWAVLIFLSTPLTFTESSSLFIESVWATFVVSGTFVLLRLFESFNKYKTNIVIVALLLAFAVATKAVTLTLLPVLIFLFFLNFKSFLKVMSFNDLVLSISIFLAVGLIPYLTALWLTGNPVFPFFNGIFQSPYYPSVNFDSATIFGKGFTWDLLYRVTFESEKYLESSVGASGFQWLLLFVPASISLLIGKDRKGLTLLAIGSLMVIFVFHSVSYLRYIFPAFVIFASVIGLSLSFITAQGKVTNVVCVFSLSVTILLNFLFLSSGAQYRDFPLKSIWGSTNRDIYLENILPIRKAVELVNLLNIGKTPVAVFAHPLSAGINSDVLYSNWYNFKFQDLINGAKTVREIADVLLQRDVTFVILDSSWSGGPEKRDQIINATKFIMDFGSISVRRVSEDYRFKTEVLKSSEFSPIQSWALSPEAIYDPKRKVLIVNVAASATQSIAVVPGQRFLNTVVAKCYKESSLGRIQINWLDSKSQLVKSDIKTFECTPDWTEYSNEVLVPSLAKTGVVYVTAHTATPIQFKSNSLKR